MDGVKSISVSVVSSLFWFIIQGCRAPAVAFPPSPIRQSPTRLDFDTDHDDKADFFCLINQAGRIDRIGFDHNADGEPDEIINLDAIAPEHCRHLVIVLDGFPYDVVKEFYQAGHLRMFYPPAVVIPPYPVMTDLALEDAFEYIPCEGVEAKYYDRKKGRIVGGTWDYLAGKNEPFVKIIDYRGPTFNDAFLYLYPKAMFEKEINEVKRIWDRRKGAETVVYLVSSAGLGSRMAKEGEIYALKRCEQLIYQILFETHGLVKITMFADHGQTNITCKSAKLDEYLKSKGYHLTDRLRDDNDVVLIKFGLVTSAALNTRNPAKLADDLVENDKVKLVSYIQGSDVIVCSKDGKARIKSTDGETFQYKPISGDPLKLADIAKGKVSGREILRLTADGKHEYPDALYRLWRAHFCLVENPPDVIASLDDHYYNGAAAFAGAVTMASTHGGLNWANSATFIMSTAGKIAGPIRSEDIPLIVGKFFKRTFPANK